MNLALRRTNFSFGSEPVDYHQTSILPDPTGHVGEYTGVLNKEVERFIKQSNLYFGNAEPEFTSTAHVGMAGGVAGDNLNDFKKTRDLTNKLKKELRTHNFSLGDDKVDYTTDHQRGFQPYTREQQQAVRGSLAKEVKADLRKCHFEFGHDEPVWETDVMASHWKVADQISKSGRNPGADKDKAKKLKAELQKTSFIIGDDPEYM
jgi:hypothetical protein